jgi:hypothetical protein
MVGLSVVFWVVLGLVVPSVGKWMPILKGSLFIVFPASEFSPKFIPHISFGQSM